MPPVSPQALKRENKKSASSFVRKERKAPRPPEKKRGQVILFEMITP